MDATPRIDECEIARLFPGVQEGNVNARTDY
jgi:hypothetical protein